MMFVLIYCVSSLSKSDNQLLTFFALCVGEGYITCLICQLPTAKESILNFSNSAMTLCTAIKVIKDRNVQDYKVCQDKRPSTKTKLEI